MQGQTTKRPETIVPSQLTVKQPATADETQTDVVLDVQSLEVHYGSFRAVKDVDMPIRSNRVTAFIGPSGCGKSTVLRCFNRMNDLIRGARVGGTILFRDVDLYGPSIDPTEMRSRIGMVFQKPNPFPKSSTRTLHSASG